MSGIDASWSSKQHQQQPSSEPWQKTASQDSNRNIQPAPGSRRRCVWLSVDKCAKYLGLCVFKTFAAAYNVYTRYRMYHPYLHWSFSDSIFMAKAASMEMSVNESVASAPQVWLHRKCWCKAITVHLSYRHTTTSITKQVHGRHSLCLFAVLCLFSATRGHTFSRFNILSPTTPMSFFFFFFLNCAAM